MMRTAEGNYQEDYHNDENVEKSDQLNDSIISCISNDTSGFSRTNSQTSTSTLTATEDNGLSPDASPLLGWPMRKPIGKLQATLTRRVMKQRSCCPDEKYAEHDSGYQDDADNVEMMKERFAKLLLGEDMSGCGKGVCTAVAISNAITNLFATAFGQLYRLEPLNIEKRLMWKREMNWLLAVCDHIVEFVPSWQTLPDGRKQEVMVSQIRCDIQINIPALQKLDAMLVGILDSFCNTEFWYVDQGAGQSDNEELGTMTPRQEQKWWLPTPRVPPRGLSDKSKKLLQKQRYCANQILKAALAINSSVLAEMEVPSSYMESLPKTGKLTLGDGIYKQITNPDHFSPDDILDTLDLKSEHNALEIANKVEAVIYVWKRKGNLCHVKSSWDLMKDFMVDGEKMEMLTERAKSLLLMLKLRCPQLSQTSLDTSKIQYNKDVGQAILESYSRVLESLAHNVVALVDDILFADESFRLSSSGKLLKIMPSASPKVLEVMTSSLQDLASSSLSDLKVSG